MVCTRHGKVLVRCCALCPRTIDNHAKCCLPALLAGVAVRGRLPHAAGAAAALTPAHRGRSGFWKVLCLGRRQGEMYKPFGCTHSGGVGKPTVFAGRPSPGHIVLLLLYNG